MSADEFDLSGLTALVVDQNHYHRRITLDQLRTMGFGRAMGAADGWEAWELLRKINPDIVLLEWMEGEGQGLDFVRRVRQSEEVPNRAVAMMILSTRGNRNDVETARRAGLNGYLIKPISALALQQRMSTAMLHPPPFVVTATYVGPCRRRKQTFVYAGPMRRLDDQVSAPADGPADEGELELRAQMARARVAALEAAAKELTPGNAKAARAVYRAVQELQEVAEQIADATLSMGAKEMMRYLQAQGATDRLDPEVVRTHITALHQLVHLPHALGDERERVAQSLRAMVDKKLRVNNAA